jgi:lipoprotein-releasing system permease protein
MKPYPLMLGLRMLFSPASRISRYLKSAVLGIGLSLVPLIVVLEVADGMIEGITRRYVELGTYHLQVLLPEPDPPPRALLEAIESAPDVRLALVERQGLGLAYAGGRRLGVTIRAIPSSLYDEDADFRRYITLDSGSFTLEGASDILLGREAADRLGVGPGEEVKLLTTVSLPGRAAVPRVTRFTVRGVFSSGYQDLDKLWVYIPLATGRRILRGDGGSEFIGVKVSDPYRRLPQQVAGLRRLLPRDARVYTWYQLEKANYKSFQTTKALLIFIMAMIVVVAAFNISSSLVMVVLEKSQEIAILKAMGAHPAEIRRTFLVTGFVTGLAGALAGLLLGLLIALNINELIVGLEKFLNLFLAAGARLAGPFFAAGQPRPEITLFNSAYYLERIPIRLRLGELFTVTALTLLLSTLAAVLPARRAGRLLPLEILRRV